MFYITLVFGLIYVWMFPGLGSFGGMLGWTSARSYQMEMDEADAKYGPIFAKYASTPIEDLRKDPQAVKMGERLYVTYCTQCHGSDAGGVRGYPNLRDKDWLWGGTPEAIKTTIMDGRTGVMPPWQAVLGDQGVEELVNHVLSLSGRKVDAQLAEAGKGKFAMCAGCHMPDGTGNPLFGAPNLTDDIWLYGGSVKAVRKSIAEGRNGRMPAHGDFLGNDKVHLLSGYIYGLSNKD
jgi:cytochrome c oxidase cbb3-type subunit 3